MPYSLESPVQSQSPVTAIVLGVKSNRELNRAYQGIKKQEQGI